VFVPSGADPRPNDSKRLAQPNPIEPVRRMPKDEPKPIPPDILAKLDQVEALLRDVEHQLGHIKQLIAPMSKPTPPAEDTHDAT
jgi:hypothetical protein